MNKTPKLTFEQQKRFRYWLVKRGVYPSYQKACNATDSHIRIHQVFLQVIGFYSFFETEDIEDICLVYMIDDDIDVNKISNCTDNLLIKDIIESNCQDNKTADIANCTDKKVRGNQKNPKMVKYDFRISQDMLQRLNTLDGAVSEHIRLAINQYLNLIDIKEQHDHFTV